MKRLPTLIGLAAALGLLGWGLWSLSQTFVAERAAAHAAVSARQIALSQYGRAAITRRLERALAESVAQGRAAEADPLVDDAGLYLRRDGIVRLPRARATRTGQSTAAVTLYEQLLDPAENPAPKSLDSPWAQRLELRLTIMRGGPAAVESGFRRLLADRARFVVAAERDVPFMLALLTWFQATGSAEPALMKMLLHDGVTDPRVGRVESLQRLLLRRRAAFTDPEFDTLSKQLVRTSQAARVPVDRFIAESQRTAATPPDVPGTLGEPLLVAGGAWYVAPLFGQTQGVAVDLTAMLEDVTAEMYGGGLFGPQDRLAVGDFGVTPARTLKVVAESPNWATEIEDAERAYASKRGLVLLCGILAVCLAALALLDQRRRRRYLALKSEFVSAVSHELRTPLAAVRVMAETLERRLVDEPLARDYPTRIVRTIDGLSFLVENILSFNRLDKGRWVAREEACDLRAVLDTVKAHLGERSTRPVEWSINAPEDTTLVADPELLRLLYTNLAQNAVLYNERDPIQLSVEITADPTALVVRFSDNGIGIAGSALPHIFTEFYRANTETNTKTRGSGLGLALCQRIMTLHQGTIRVAETGPSGTSFEVRHPRRA